MEQQTQNLDQLNSLPIKEVQFKLTNQKGQAYTVRLFLMDQEFVRIQILLSRTCWQINMNMSQALKLHNVFFLNNSIEELFSYVEDCFKQEQVQIETQDSLAYLTFNQSLGIKQIEFKITLKQIEMNIQQIVQEMAIEFEKMSTKVEEMTTKVEEMSTKSEEMSTKSEEMSTQFQEKLLKAQNKISQLEEEIQRLKINSLILKEDEKDIVIKWVSAGKVVSHFELLLRGSSHGFKASTYNLKCDGKGPLICFVQSQNQRRFGGYIHLKYQKDLGNYVAANPNNSFLFSLDDKKQYLSNETSCSCAYYSHSSYGFIMGGGHDLKLVDNCNTNSSSFSNLGGSYGKNQGGNNQSLAGTYQFQVEEIEVFEVIYKQ